MINNKGCTLYKLTKQNIYNVYDETKADYDVLSIKELKAMLNYYIEYESFMESMVLKNVRDFLKGKNMKNIVYFKLAWDKHKNLIALFFNIDNFIETGTEHIWLFTNSPQNKRTFLQMSFWNNDSQFSKPFRKNVAHLYINDFRSYYPRMGHGSFILRNLEHIIIEINKLISLSHENLFTIKSIVGIVVPLITIITYEDLIKIYTNNGFAIIHQKRPNGRNKTIIIKPIKSVIL